MKTMRTRFRQTGRSRDGSAVILLFMVIAILVMLVTSNSRTVISLSDELRLVEKRQLGHWEGTRTNRTVRVVKPASPGGQP